MEETISPQKKNDILANKTIQEFKETQSLYSPLPAPWLTKRCANQEIGFVYLKSLLKQKLF